MPTPENNSSTPEYEEVTAQIGHPTRSALIAAAGGRCEFLGCPRYLFEHHVTKKPRNFSQCAHIIAFRPAGPRGDVEPRPAGINAFENLMLLCPSCHKLVDDAPAEFPAEKLRGWKQCHEERVRWLLDLPTENEAAVLEIWTNVAPPPVVRSRSKVIAALLPLYPSKAHEYLINLAAHTMTDKVLVPAAAESIDAEVGKLFATTGERPAHLAVFGITNIPLLVYLGSRLGDRIHTHLYQHHRDTKDWKWKDEEPKASYATRVLREGKDPKRVALVASLSGSIIPEAGLAAAKLPVDNTYTIHEIRLTSTLPNPDFLRTLPDLTAFQSTYRTFLAQLNQRHGRLEALALFPAVPVPVAISLGMDRLPKVHPALAVYDHTKAGWEHVLTVQ